MNDRALLETLTKSAAATLALVRSLNARDETVYLRNLDGTPAKTSGGSVIVDHRGDDRTPLERMADGHAGQPKAARYDSGTEQVRDPKPMVDTGDGWRPLTSDPTGNAATTHDQAATDRRRLSTITNTIRDLLDEADTIRKGYGPPRNPTDIDRMALEREGLEEGEGCEACALVDSPHRRGVPHWEPVHVAKTTVSGNLEEPWDLCRWHYEYVRRKGELPSNARTKKHAERTRRAA